MPLRATVRDLKTSFASLVQRAEVARLHRQAGHHRRSDRGERCDREDHPGRSDLGRRGRQRQAPDVALDHAALRDRIPAEARSPAERHFLDEIKHFNDIFEFGRRRADDEGKAQSGSPALQLRLRAMGGEHRQYRSPGVADQPRHRERAAGSQQDHCQARDDASAAAAGLAASRAHTRQFIIWVDLAVILIVLGFSWRIGRSITHPLEKLAGAMKRLADGDTSAQIPLSQSARRDRRHGAHRGGVPRQHDRARATRRHPAREQRGARAARRGHCRSRSAGSAPRSSRR